MTDYPFGGLRLLGIPRYFDDCRYVLKRKFFLVGLSQGGSLRGVKFLVLGMSWCELGGPVGRFRIWYLHLS